MIASLVKKGLLALGLAAMTLAGPSTAKAGFSLADLIAGTYVPIPGSGVTTLTGHDVYYDGIDYVFGAGSYLPTGVGAPTAANIAVTAVTIGGIDTLRFAGGFFAGPGQTNDSAIAYEVTVLKGPPVTDLHLTVTGGAKPPGFYSVDDAVVNLNPPGESYALGVDSTGAPSVGPILTGPLTHFHVNKDIFLYGGADGAGGNARLSVIDQGYSRRVPEPASMALLVMGGAGLLGMKRRRKIEA